MMIKLTKQVSIMMIFSGYTIPYHTEWNQCGRKGGEVIRGFTSLAQMSNIFHRDRSIWISMQRPQRLGTRLQNGARHSVCNVHGARENMNSTNSLSSEKNQASKCFQCSWCKGKYALYILKVCLWKSVLSYLLIWHQTIWGVCSWKWHIMMMKMILLNDDII